MELRAAAYAAFLIDDCDEKTALVQGFPSRAPLPGQNMDAGDDAGWDLDCHVRFALGALPGRPARPVVIDPRDMPRRTGNQVSAHAALVHAICHIELNAINLALDAIWRFADMPTLYYWQWARVAVEESRHFLMLRAHLRGLPAVPVNPQHQPTPFDYGDFPAHDGLWDMCERTKDDVVARMALVPRTLEARGLDATPIIQNRLKHIPTDWAQAASLILDQLLADEIGHVAIGNYWYKWLCDRQGFNPLSHFKVLSRTHRAPTLKPPFNTHARYQAGFDAQEMIELERGQEG